MLATMAGMVMVALIGKSALFAEKPIPIGRADGQYVNARCGLITLRAGVISWGASRAQYTLHTDKLGLFALTEHFLGVATDGARCEVLYDPERFPLYLRFDNNKSPNTVILSDTALKEDVVFTRQPICFYSGPTSQINQQPCRILNSIFQRNKKRHRFTPVDQTVVVA
jgi:hypothetical protein